MPHPAPQADASGRLQRAEEERQFLRQLSDSLLANQKDFQARPGASLMPRCRCCRCWRRWCCLALQALAPVAWCLALALARLARLVLLAAAGLGLALMTGSSLWAASYCVVSQGVGVWRCCC